MSIKYRPCRFRALEAAEIQAFSALNVPLATLVLCLISCLDMEQQHDDKSKPADHIKPKLICIGDNKRQQPENDRPGSRQQHPDYPKSKACFLEKQQQREYSRADQHAQCGVQREKVIAAHAGYNTEGDTVKNNDMPDKKPHYHKDKANYKTDY